MVKSRSFSALIQLALKIVVLVITYNLNLQMKENHFNPLLQLLIQTAFTLVINRKWMTFVN